jgi:hypothetical protein
MIEEFNYQVSLAYDKHPDLKKLVKRSSKVLDDPKEPTKALKVSITLPVHEWLFVDESIKNHDRSIFGNYIFLVGGDLGSWASQKVLLKQHKKPLA